jgi:hypothetical protein
MHPDDDENTTPGDTAESNLTDALARFQRPAPVFDSAEDAPIGIAGNVPGDETVPEEGEANGDTDEESGEADESAETETPGEDADAGETASEAPEAEGLMGAEDFVGVAPEPVIVNPSPGLFVPVSEGNETPPLSDPQTPADSAEPDNDEPAEYPPAVLTKPEEGEDFDWDDDDWDCVIEYNSGFNAALDAVLELMDCGTDVILAAKCHAINKLRK